jgi:hypothetical protein
MPNPFFMLFSLGSLQSLGPSKLCNRSGLSGFSARFASPQAQPSVTHLSLLSLVGSFGTSSALHNLPRNLSNAQNLSSIMLKRIDRESYRRSCGTFVEMEPFPRSPFGLPRHSVPSKRKERMSYRRSRNLRTPLTSRRSLSLSNSHALWDLLRSSSHFASLRFAQLTLPLHFGDAVSHLISFKRIDRESYRRSRNLRRLKHLVHSVLFHCRSKVLH